MYAAAMIALSPVAAGAHEWQMAALLFGLGTSLLGLYAGLVKTHRCGGYAPTTDDGVCGNAPRGGLLRGCHLHRWWRVKRLLGIDPDERQPGHRPRPNPPVHIENIATLVAINVATTNEPRGERLMLWSTVLSAAVRNLMRFLRQVVQGFVGSIVWSGSSGLLIHTVVGSSGGSGCLRTKRSGWRRKASVRTVARAARTSGACP